MVENVDVVAFLCLVGLLCLMKKEMVPESSTDRSEKV